MKEDVYTNTVEDAADYERRRAADDDDRHDDAKADAYISEDDYIEDDDRECNCSDPGCPCGGRKYGRL